MISKFVHVLFQIFIAGLIIAVFFIDKSIKTTFPNTVHWNNSGYFIIAFCLLCMIGYFMVRKEQMEERQWKFLTIFIAAATTCLQLIVSIWMPEKISADFKPVREMAVNLAEGGVLAGSNYFIASPNNINITLVLSLVYRMFHSWRAVIFIGALLTNFSVVLVSVSVKKVTENRFCGIFSEITGELLIAMTWRAFLPYTDNYAMFFVAVMIFTYTSQIKANVKIPLIIVAGLAGSFIKQTVLIILFTFALHSFLSCIEKKEVHRYFRQIGIALVIFLAGTIVQKNIQTLTRNTLGYEASKTSKNWTYLFMVGQNSHAYGVVNGTDGNVRNKILKQYPQEEWNKVFVREALERIKSRGLYGNMGFYLMKLNVAYNDGYFHNMRGFTDENVAHNHLYSFYIDSDTELYALGADMMQVLWDIILILFILNSYILCRKKIMWCDTLCEIAILGITLYLMVFEGRAKYIYMFLPVYLFYAGVIFSRFLLFCQETVVHETETSDTAAVREAGTAGGAVHEDISDQVIQEGGFLAEAADDGIMPMSDVDDVIKNRCRRN